ncbi:Flp family type IVb pilin [Sphingomonas sp. PAMC 26605]|uniref:Flp family type IVb pilin n=1 Tax=Sphingomonas sp. PAMC 26605 TaxID=1112214 RepID=UPI00026CACA2|nr:Flp family type IVb pilin [Sphingomonas sp. PAMC 26605]
MIVRMLTRLSKDRRGGTAIEYGLIAGLVVITMIAAFTQVATITTTIWGTVTTKVSTTGAAK